jgi:hypothetical protein
MWLPKHIDNEMYVGKMARIYYKDGHRKNTEYVEGELIYILKSETMKYTYSVQILDNDNKYTKHTCTNDIIKKIKIEMFEIDENVHQLCKQYLAQDLGNEINQYVDNYIEI